jgi:hypothetical protein
MTDSEFAALMAAYRAEREDAVSGIHPACRPSALLAYSPPSRWFAARGLTLPDADSSHPRWPDYLAWRERALDPIPVDRREEIARCMTPFWDWVNSQQTYETLYTKQAKRPAKKKKTRR